VVNKVTDQSNVSVSPRDRDVALYLSQRIRDDPIYLGISHDISVYPRDRDVADYL